MKRRLVLLTLLSALLLSAHASHIKGGFFTYRFLGMGTVNPTYYRYKITLTVYMRCDASGPQLINNPVNFTFFDAGTNQFVETESASITSQYQLSKTQDDPCITGDQTGCYYLVIVYTLNSVELAPRANGYTISYQRCCRIAGMQNIVNSGTVGATYSITIPGTSAPFNAVTNNSPTFPVNDTVVVCYNKQFSYSFQAVDLDGDSLSYSFCDAYQGGGQDNNGNGCTTAAPDPACPPPYSSVPYAFPYSGSQPLGAGVSINPKTGVISGVAPVDEGEYVVTVCINEFRNGVFIATSRKELHVVVKACDLVQASLNPSYITCDGFTLTFSNNTPSALIQNYYWDFGVNSISSDTSILPTPTYTYPDTGIYVVKLVVNKGLACTDSTSSIAKVYPGFFPGFIYSGICANHLTQFTDTTKTAYGFVNSWFWNFGAPASNDTSHLQNPVYTYPTPGTYNVLFIVSNSKGCIDTINKNIDIMDKPPLTIAPKDTLICVSDQVQLNAIGQGTFTWTGPNISNATIANPVVSPPTTSWYYVQLNQNGCLNNDSARVRVVDHVTLSVRNDTTSCQGDPVQLTAQTNGLQYHWSPILPLNNPNILDPIAVVNANTTFEITATIGSCQAIATVNVFVVPYPKVNAGPDTTICFNTAAQLHSTFKGTSFNWTPIGTLNNPNSPNPTATPGHTTTYVLTVYDTLGCPKPGRDSVTVTVLPKVKAFAGKDTSVVVGEPLHFNASGGVSYVWSPPTALSDPNIHNPVAVYDGSFDQIRYRVLVTDAIGCMDSSFINVKIFHTEPQIFVPSAFTPNGDGRNDVIRPIGVGIKKIEYFRIYNRWGQLVFETTINGKGWDGKIAGQEQGTATFVWIASGIDYLDRHFFKKGTVTLIK